MRVQSKGEASTEPSVEVWVPAVTGADYGGGGGDGDSGAESGEIHSDPEEGEEVDGTEAQ